VCGFTPTCRKKSARIRCIPLSSTKASLLYCSGLVAGVQEEVLTDRSPSLIYGYPVIRSIIEIFRGDEIRVYYYDVCPPASSYRFLFFFRGVISGRLIAVKRGRREWSLRRYCRAVVVIVFYRSVPFCLLSSNDGFGAARVAKLLTVILGF